MERVAVVGCIGAGKSTVATRLGAVTGLPVVHLDHLWWQDGSYRVTGMTSVADHTMPAQAFRDLQVRLASEDEWIIRYPSQKRPAIEEALARYCEPSTEIIRLRSRDEGDAFLRRWKTDDRESPEPV